MTADLDIWQTRIHALATSKGWWDGYERKDGSVVMTTDQILAKLALIHSEVSEALEDVRVGKMARTGGVVRMECGCVPADLCAMCDCTGYYESATKPEGFPSELADVVIRCLDLAGALGIDLTEEIRVKHSWNERRSHRHGNKLA